MKYLIFGGTGFVGEAVKKFLIKKGEEVFSVSRSGGENAFAVDISQKEGFSKINFIPDVVINCASKLPEGGRKSSDPDFLRELFLTNVVGGANIANWTVENKVSRLLNCSTLVVTKKPWPVPLPENYSEVPEGFHAGYALSKLSQEKIMSECVAGSGTAIHHLRLSAVYGPGMKVEGIIFHVLKKILAKEKVLLQDADKNLIDLIHVEDIARYLYEISQINIWNDFEVINLASGKEISVLDLAEQIRLITGSSSEIENNKLSTNISRALIDITRLKTLLGDRFQGFRELEKGLGSIVKIYSAKEAL